MAWNAISAKKILIVEDEKPMAKALEVKLIKEGFYAKAVFNGKEALDILQSEKFDLMLLDLLMPEMGGFDLLQKLSQKRMAQKKNDVIKNNKLNNKQPVSKKIRGKTK